MPLYYHEKGPPKEYLNKKEISGFGVAPKILKTDGVRAQVLLEKRKRCRKRQPYHVPHWLESIY